MFPENACVLNKEDNGNFGKKSILGSVIIIKVLQQVYKKRNDLRIHYRGEGRFWSYFRGKNRPIYMAQCCFLVLGGPFDKGSRPRVVNDWYLLQCISNTCVFCKPTVQCQLLIVRTQNPTFLFLILSKLLLMTWRFVTSL